MRRNENQICPICEKEDGYPFLYQEGVPVLNNILCTSFEEARRVPVGVLDFYGCAHCGFVWNNAFDENLVCYGSNYENNQSHSSVFKNHLNEVVGEIQSLMAYKPFSVIEVGCGQGYFLDLLESMGEGIKGLGFDPALRGRRETTHSLLVPEYARSDLVPPSITAPLLLLSRHVIEHIKNPYGFMLSLLALSPEFSAIALETPCVEWILREKAFFDFYYEHCSIFTSQSLSWLLSRLGWKNNFVKSLFGEQYLLGMASLDFLKKDEQEFSSRRFTELLSEFQRERATFCERWQETLNQWKREGYRVAIWGGGSKGVMFANMLGEVSAIFAAIDINPAKQGRFLPLSALPVLSPLEAKDAGIDRVIVMNPNYFDEIRFLCNEIKFAPCLIAI